MDLPPLDKRVVHVAKIVDCHVAYPRRITVSQFRKYVRRVFFRCKMLDKISRRQQTVCVVY